MKYRIVKSPSNKYYPQQQIDGKWESIYRYEFGSGKTLCDSICPSKLPFCKTLEEAKILIKRSKIQLLSEMKSNDILNIVYEDKIDETHSDS